MTNTSLSVISTPETHTPAQKSNTSPSSRQNRSRFTLEQETFIARILAQPSVWNIVRRPMSSVRSLAPKSRVLLAFNDKFFQEFPSSTSALVDKPSARVTTYWVNKAGRVHKIWKRATDVANNPKNRKKAKGHGLGRGQQGLPLSLHG